MSHMRSTVLEAFLPRITEYVRHRLNKVNASLADVDEITQETLIRLWQMEGVEQHPELDALVFSVAGGKVIDFLRAQKRSKAVGETNCEPMYSDSIPWSSDRDDTLDRVEPLIQRLPPRLRRVMECKLQGLTTPQIASQIGTGEWGVHSRMRRAMSKLRKFAAEASVVMSFLLAS